MSTMKTDIFNDLMSNDGATGMVDPMTDEVYNPVEDFETFQEESEATYLRSEDNAQNPTVSLMDGVTESSPQLENTDDLLITLLKSKGINPDSIKIQNEENDEVEEVKFTDLTEEEKLELLNYNHAEEDYDYSDPEIEAIEFLRENNMSIQELAKVIREKTIAEISAENDVVYTVDDFTDEELFLADFKNKYGEDFTEVELMDSLNKAKESEDLFTKQMNKVRETYREYEKEEKEQEHLEKENALKEKENAYIAKVVEVARSMDDLHDIIEMDDDDKEEVLGFMFNKTVTGESFMDKALTDPKTRYKAAWYIKNGDEAFKQIHNYYQSEIKKLTKLIPASTKPKVEAVIKEPNKQLNIPQKRPKRLEDLFK